MPMDWQRVEGRQGHATQDAEHDALRKERRTSASNPSRSLFTAPWFPVNSFNAAPGSLPGSSEIKRGKTNQSEVLFFLSLRSMASGPLAHLTLSPVESATLCSSIPCDVSLFSISQSGWFARTSDHASDPRLPEVNPRLPEIIRAWRLLYESQ
jgi:hypothetical protein